MAEACDLLGTGCRERIESGRARFDFWLAPAAAPAPQALAAHLAARGHRVDVAAAPERTDWRAALRAFHRPVEVGGRILVRPPWAPARPGLLDVEIDPGMAFGTGQHATTLGCLELLAGLTPGGPLVDAGAGTGVLAIAARRLGFDPVWAFDHDPLAVEAAIANARRNGVALCIARRTIGRDPLPAVPTVVANLTATVLAVLADALPRPAPRRLIVSGLRPEEAEPTAVRFTPHGLRPARRLDRDGWATLLLERL